MFRHLIKLIIVFGALAFVAFCYSQIQTNSMKPVDFSKESGLTTVMTLADDFKNRGDTNALARLALLVEDPKFGANALGAMVLLASTLNDSQIKTLVMPAIIRGLESSRPDIRRESGVAVCHFVKFANPAIPVLRRSLLGDINASGFAVDALGKIGPPASDAIPDLLKVLDQPETESGGFEEASVRVRSVEAIGLIGITSDRARKRIEAALSDSNSYVEAKSAQALIRNTVSSQQAIETLTRLMNSKDLEVRLFVLAMLEEFGSIPKPLTDEIQKLKSDENPDVRQAVSSLLSKSNAK